MQPPRIPRTQLSVPTTWRTIVLWAMLGAPAVCGADPQLSYPAREFRAAWVATVANIDWPSQPGLPAQQQRDELLRIFDRAAELNLNALILQFRPACDALYVSDREPWSPYLSGHMGQAPRPFYDPLAFAVEQAHRRGLELHAWFNPYRALHKTFKGQVSPNHISKTMPAAVKSYDGYLWLDPGNPQAVRHSLDVITDVVRRYDIDGVHLDDYFYPYPTKDGDGRQIPFPDDESFAKWAEANSPESPRSDAADAATERNEWRRQNVDSLIERLYVEVKAIKPHVKVGISPFGIWRPGHPESIKGFDAYDQIFADSRKWLKNGWVDYLTPQLYWTIESTGQSYPALLAWWRAQNVQSKFIWPGNYASRVGMSGERAWPAEEIVEQVRITRKQGASGNVLFSMKSLFASYGNLGPALKDGPYEAPALIPAHPSSGIGAGNELKFVLRRLGPRSWTPRIGNDQAPWLWLVWRKTSDEWQYEILPGHSSQFDLAENQTRLAVAHVNRAGQVGEPRIVSAEAAVAEQ